MDQSAPAPCDLDPVKRASADEEALPASEAEDLDSFNLIEPPPLDWRSDSSSEAGSADVLDDPSLGLTGLGGPVTLPLVQLDTNQVLLENVAEPEVQPKEDSRVGLGDEEEDVKDDEMKVDKEEVEVSNRRPGDEDHSRIHSLLSQLQLMEKEPHPGHQTPSSDHRGPLELEAQAPSVLTENRTGTTGLLFSDSHHRDLLGLLQCTEISSTSDPPCLPHRGQVDAVVLVSYSQEDAQVFSGQNGRRQRDDSIASLPDEEYPEPVWMKLGEEPPEDDPAAESDPVSAETTTSSFLPFEIQKYVIISDDLLNKPCYFNTFSVKSVPQT